MFSRLQVKNKFRSASTQKWFWLIVMLVVGAVYYSQFAFSIIPPQTGWWQYMAQRLTEGEFLYKDVYMYIPPYYPWFTTLLYQLFGKQFAWYTLFGIVFLRMLPWALIYLMLTRIVKPNISAVCVIFGAFLTSSYLMDMPYDYNPLLMCLVIIQAYWIMIAFETEKTARIYWIAILEGIICGVHIMMKQNVGIIMPFVIFPSLGIIAFKKNIRKWWRVLAVCCSGIIAAVVPGVIYLVITDTWKDFLWCITVALDAKMGGGGNLLVICVRNFVSIKNLLVAGALWLLYLCATTTNESIKAHESKIAVLLGFLIAIKYEDYLRVLIRYLNIQSTKLWITLLIVGCAFFIFIVWVLWNRRNRKRAHTVMYFVFWILMVAGMFFCTTLSETTGAYMYYNLDMRSLVRDVLYTMLYMLIFFWCDAVYQGLIKKDDKALSFALPYFVILGFLAVSFISAELEELYALLFVPVTAAVLLNVMEGKTNEETSVSTVTNDTDNCAAKKPLFLIGLSLAVVYAFCMLCFLQKLYIPYEWHSWRTASLLNVDNPVIPVEVEGLEGYRLASSDAETYMQIADLIEQNTAEDDIVYQFPNIPLFNVITNRKTVYMAIPYFDVCPDALAIESAEDLYQNPPKMVIWANLSEERWTTHEIVFRNGNQSGQREIQAFYEDVVRNQYDCLGSYSNNEGETIEVWLQSGK